MARAGSTSGAEARLTLASADGPAALRDALQGSPDRWRFDPRQRHRVAVVWYDEADRQRKLSRTADSLARHPYEPLHLPDGVYYSGASDPEPGPLAAIFPAAQALAASVHAVLALRSAGLAPAILAGWGITGEIVALWAAGALELEALEPLLRFAAVPGGDAMLAVEAPGAATASLRQWLALWIGAGGPLREVAEEGPGRLVLAGPPAALQQALEALGQRARSWRLPPTHRCRTPCSGVGLEAALLRAGLGPMRPGAQVISALDGRPHPRTSRRAPPRGWHSCSPGRCAGARRSMPSSAPAPTPSPWLGRATDTAGRWRDRRDVEVIALDDRGPASLLHALGRLAILGHPVRAPAGGRKVPSTDHETTMRRQPPQPPQRTLGEGTMTRDDDQHTQHQPLDRAWIDAFQDGQRHLLEAHSTYQQAMTSAHMAFMRAVESSQSNLVAMLQGRSPQLPSLASGLAPRQELAGALAPSPQPPPLAQRPQPAPAPRPAPARAPAPPGPAPRLAAQPPPAAPAPQRPQPQAATAGPGGADVEALLLEVVSQKTGYPSEMLELGMSLEADLGIDSIKRVEILSALGERLPGLPEVEGSQMAELQTLGQVLDFMHDAMGGSAGSPAPQPQAAAAGPGGADVEALLLEVVSQKTGYPSEMLELGMSLEADLGIDSIKRVEILSALGERLPGLPEVEGSQMAELQTLGQVLDFMHDAMGSDDLAEATASFG